MIEVQGHCGTCGAESRLIRGLCGKCYRRARHRGEMDALTDEDRYWRAVNKDGPISQYTETPCWDWTRSGVRNYGRIMWHGKRILAHRVAWELARGEKPPDDLEVMHLCHRPSCVNPEHLTLGTHYDNMHHDVIDGRSAAQDLSHGETHHSSKLTADKVREIRRRHAQGETLASIGRALGVTYVCIGAVVKGKTWRHVAPDLLEAV